MIVLDIILALLLLAYSMVCVSSVLLDELSRKQVAIELFGAVVLLLAAWRVIA